MDEIMEEMELDAMSEDIAQRIVKWALNHGHSKEEAYEALAYSLNATVEQIKGDD